MNVQRVTLGSIATIISGGTPTKSRPEFWNGSIPWISAKTMKKIKISTSNLFISEEGLLAGSKLAPIGSLLILTRGSELFNRVPICYVTSEVAFNQDVKCVIPSEVVDSQFFYYVLTTKEKYLSEKVGVTGIGAGKLETDILQNLEIDLPAKVIQQKIVEQIKRYDSKIDLNEFHIETLVMFLQTLYQNWFLNFNYPDSSGEMQSGIPDGWTNSNVFDNVNEVREKNKDNLDYPVLSVVKEGEFKPSGDVFTKQVYSKSTTNYKVVRRNQVGYNPARANIGSIAMLTDFEAGLVSPIYIVFEVKSSITPTFFHYYMKQPMFVESIKHHAIGTTRQNFPFEAFKMFPIVVPPIDLQKRFEEIAKPIEKKIAKLKEENKVLAEIRDILLPKLISGELPVKVGEK